MALISITRLRVRAWRFMPAFLWYAFRSSRQAQRSQGFLRGRLIVDARRTFWTLTAWADEAAMRAYRANDSHGAAMRKLPHWCDEASVAHWTQQDATLPLPEQAHRRMAEEGRASRVEHPSADHTAQRISTPKVRAQNDLPPRRAVKTKAASVQS